MFFMFCCTGSSLKLNPLNLNGKCAWHGWSVMVLVHNMSIAHSLEMGSPLQRAIQNRILLNLQCSALRETGYQCRNSVSSVLPIVWFGFVICPHCCNLKCSPALSLPLPGREISIVILLPPFRPWSRAITSHQYFDSSTALFTLSFVPIKLPLECNPEKSASLGMGNLYSDQGWETTTIIAGLFAIVICSHYLQLEMQQQIVRFQPDWIRPPLCWFCFLHSDWLTGVHPWTFAIHLSSLLPLEIECGNLPSFACFAQHCRKLKRLSAWCHVFKVRNPQGPDNFDSHFKPTVIQDRVFSIGKMNPWGKWYPVMEPPVWWKEAHTVMTMAAGFRVAKKLWAALFLSRCWDKATPRDDSFLIQVKRSSVLTFAETMLTSSGSWQHVSLFFAQLCVGVGVCGHNFLLC